MWQCVSMCVALGFLTISEQNTWEIRSCHRLEKGFIFGWLPIGAKVTQSFIDQITLFEHIDSG